MLIFLILLYMDGTLADMKLLYAFASYKIYIFKKLNSRLYYSDQNLKSTIWYNALKRYIYVWV